MGGVSDRLRPEALRMERGFTRLRKEAEGRRCSRPDSWNDLERREKREGPALIQGMPLEQRRGSVSG